MAPSYIAGRPVEHSGEIIDTDASTGWRSERRFHRRLALHCSLYISRGSLAEPVKCVVRNMSSGGFYCISTEAFGSGDWLQCTIVFPTTESVTDAFTLECIVEVLRIESLDSGQSFGLACRIEDYVVVPTTPGTGTIQ